MIIQRNRYGVAAAGSTLCLCTYLMFFRRHASSSAVLERPSPINLRKLMCVAILAAERGGLEVHAVQQARVLNSRNKGPKEISNPVTDGDLRSHFVMMRTLKDAFPNLHVMSEEHGTSAVHLDREVEPLDDSCMHRTDIRQAFPLDLTASSDTIQVWIDPLDATQEYTENLLHYVTTMVGIAINGRAVAGVIHKPFVETAEKRTYWAWVGRGRSANLAVSQPENRSKVRIIVSRSHAGNVQNVAHAAFPDRTIEVTPAGGAGYKTLEVLLGNEDVYLHVTKIKKWDLCAPNGILNALGGRMTTLAGKDIDYSDTGLPDGEVNYGGVIGALHDHERFVQAFRSQKHSGI